jgi:hypothetical protein
MKKWIVCMVIGLLPLLGAVGVFRGDGKPGEITCGSETMRPGDVCEETQRGVPVDTETYEEKLQEAKEAANDFTPTRRWVSFGIGMALECLGIVGMVVTRRRRATRPTTTADIALGQRPHPGSGSRPAIRHSSRDSRWRSTTSRPSSTRSGPRSNNSPSAPTGSGLPGGVLR